MFISDVLYEGITSDIIGINEYADLVDAVYSSERLPYKYALQIVKILITRGIQPSTIRDYHLIVEKYRNWLDDKGVDYGS